MAVPTFRRILPEELGEGLPSWVRRFLTPINQFIRENRDILDGSVTFQDNIRSSIRTFTFTTASDYVANDTFTRLTFDVGFKAVGVMIGRCEELDDGDHVVMTSAVSLDWTQDGLNIRLNHVSGLADSTDYRLTVIVV